MYNYAFVTYDKSLIGETPIKAVELSDEDLAQGDSVYLVGMCGNYLPAVKKTTIKCITYIESEKCDPPRWRAVNVDEIRLDDFIETIGIYLLVKDLLFVCIISYSKLIFFLLL